VAREAGILTAPLIEPLTLRMPWRYLVPSNLGVALATNDFSEGVGAAALAAQSHAQSDMLSGRLRLRADVPLLAAVSTVVSRALAWPQAAGDLSPQTMLAFTSDSMPFTVSKPPLAADAWCSVRGFQAISAIQWR